MITIEEFHIQCLPILNPELEDLDFNFNVPKFHWDIYNKLQEYSRLQLITAPVGFAKSTLLKIFAVYEVLIKRSEKFVLYVSSTDTKATEHLEGITKLIKNQDLQLLYKYKVITSNTHELVIQFDDSEQKYKFEAIASGADIAGKNFEGIRPGLIIIDDLEDLDQAKSIDRTNKLEDWLFTVLIARLPSLSSGRIRMINTVLTLDSITNRILGKAPSIDKNKYRDWNKLFIQALDEHDQSIWEERHPTSHLHIERELRPLSFYANYMNSPLDLSESMIKMDDLEFYEHIDINDFQDIYVHADTTHTAKTTSDYFCLMAIAESIKDKRYYILDFVLDKLEVEQQAEALIALYRRFDKKIKKITFDEKANQGFGFWTRKLAREKYNLSLPLQELKYGSDKVTHFEPHTVHFKSKRVVFPKHHKDIQTGINQLTAFPSKSINDDFIDGISGCLDNYLSTNKLNVRLLEL